MSRQGILACEGSLASLASEGLFTPVTALVPSEVLALRKSFPTETAIHDVASCGGDEWQEALARGGEEREQSTRRKACGEGPIVWGRSYQGVFRVAPESTWQETDEKKGADRRNKTLVSGELEGLRLQLLHPSPPHTIHLLSPWTHLQLTKR